MAAERKLKTEIDKCFKKVAEGQEDFEVLWNQVMIGLAEQAELHCLGPGNPRPWVEP